MCNKKSYKSIKGKIEMKSYNLFIKKTSFAIVMSMLSFLSFAATNSAINLQSEKELNPYNPTKIVSRISLGYSNAVHVSGAYAPKENIMFSGAMSDELYEWKAGASVLFNDNIYNLSYHFRQFDEDAVDYMSSVSIDTYFSLAKKRYSSTWY